MNLDFSILGNRTEKESGSSSVSVNMNESLDRTNEIFPEHAEMPRPMTSKIEPHFFSETVQPINTEQLQYPQKSVNQETMNHHDEEVPMIVAEVLQKSAQHIPNGYNLTYDSNAKKFFISGINKFVKISFVQMLSSWNTNSPFYSVLFDAKFVDLTLVQIIGKNNLIDENISKKDMRFIQAVFKLRVGNDVSRAIRFGNYVQQKKASLKKMNQE